MFVWALMLMSACPSLISIKVFTCYNILASSLEMWVLAVLTEFKIPNLLTWGQSRWTKEYLSWLLFSEKTSVSSRRARREGSLLPWGPIVLWLIWGYNASKGCVLKRNMAWFSSPSSGVHPLTISNHLISYLFFLCPSFFLHPPHLSSSARTHLLASFLCFREILDINVVFFLDCVALCSFWLFPLSPTWAISL